MKEVCPPSYAHLLWIAEVSSLFVVHAKKVMAQVKIGSLGFFSVWLIV